MINKTFLVAGDSWGCGQWEKTHHGSEVTHGGLAQLLYEDGHRVFNVSRGGNSNNQSVELLRDFLLRHTFSRIDKVIVFQTDWQRDLESVAEKTFDSINEVESYLISQFYHSLSVVATDFGVPIYVIGGLSDTVWLEHFESEYPGIQIICQSLVNLCLNDDHRVKAPTLSVYTVKGQNLNKIIKDNTRFKKDFETGFDLGSTRTMLLETEKPWFWPDGMHANLSAHRKLHKFIRSNHPAIFD